MLFYSFCPCHEPQGTGHWAIRTEYKLDMTWNRMISGAWIARGNGNGDIAYYLKPDGRLVQNETILQPLKRNEGCRRVRDAICWNLLVFFAKRRWAFFGNIGLYSWQKPSNGRPSFSRKARLWFLILAGQPWIVNHFNLKMAKLARNRPVT